MEQSIFPGFCLEFSLGFFPRLFPELIPKLFPRRFKGPFPRLFPRLFPQLFNGFLHDASSQPASFVSAARLRARFAVLLLGAIYSQLCNPRAIPRLGAQSEPVYLEKYTISKVYFEGAEDLNRYYIFSFLQFKEGDTLTPLQLQRRIDDTRRILRTQWYFQAEFEPHYYADGRVEIFVMLEPSPQRFGFMGGANDGHSAYLGFTGKRQAPGSSLRTILGRTIGIAWYLPHMYNSSFGLNVFAQANAWAQTQSLLQSMDIEQLNVSIFWLRSGLEEFIQATSAIKLGLTQEYWGTIASDNSDEIVSEVAVGAYIDLNWLYLLKSRLWAVQFYFEAKSGLLNGFLMLRGKSQLALLPTRWLELDAHLAVTANISEHLNIGALDAAVPGANPQDNLNDLYALGRLRAILLLSHNDYDSHQTEFNAGFALEGKWGLFAAVFNPENPLDPQSGSEIQGGLVLDVLTPGAFTTRFFLLTGLDLAREVPVAEFMVETRF